MGILYCVKFSQNNSGSVELIEGASIVSSFFVGMIFCLFVLPDFIFFIKLIFSNNYIFIDYSNKLILILIFIFH